MDKEDVEEFIAENLHELAWRNDYPVNERAGVWCFLNGMRNAGFVVDIKQEPYHIFDTFQFNGKIWETNASLSIVEVAEGWKQAPRASPQSFYQSMYKAIDRMQEQVKRDFPETPNLPGFYRLPNDISKALCNERCDKAHKSLKFMEKHFLEYFTKYQEGFLAKIGNASSQLNQPAILPALFREGIINLERMNFALQSWRDSGSGLSSTDRTIAFLREGIPFEEPEVISEDNVYGYIWGNYLLSLARAKRYEVGNYSTDETTYGMLEIACDRGWDVLERARV